MSPAPEYIIPADPLRATPPVVLRRRACSPPATHKTHPPCDDGTPENRQHRPHDKNIALSTLAAAVTVAAIQASGLVKTFGTTRSVRGLDMTVPHGGVFGLPGPNGAGKTTTIRIPARLTWPYPAQSTVLRTAVPPAPP